MTLTVCFRSHARWGVVETAGTVTMLADGSLAFDDDAEPFLRSVNVVEPGTLVPLTFEDGERYLRALPYNFRGSYFWAELVES